MKIVNRVFAIIFLFIFSVFSFIKFTPLAYAQSYSSNLEQILPETNPDVPKNTHTLVQTLTIDVLSTIFCYLAGFDPLTKNKQCIWYDFKTGKLGYSSSMVGALGL